MIKGDVPLLLRNRLRCTFESDDVSHQKISWLSLNEIVIGRGPSPFISNLDLYINDYLITTVQGDGEFLF